VAKLTRAEVEALEYEAQQRKERMEATEVRIARTPAGERFLDRMYEIRKPRPLRGEEDKESTA
jgi:hypothetical protein